AYLRASAGRPGSRAPRPASAAGVDGGQPDLRGPLPRWIAARLAVGGRDGGRRLRNESRCRRGLDAGRHADRDSRVDPPGRNGRGQGQCCVGRHRPARRRPARLTTVTARPRREPGTRMNRTARTLAALAVVAGTVAAVVAVTTPDTDGLTVRPANADGSHTGAPEEPNGDDVRILDDY